MSINCINKLLCRIKSICKSHHLVISLLSNTIIDSKSIVQLKKFFFGKQNVTYFIMLLPNTFLVVAKQQISEITCNGLMQIMQLLTFNSG